MKHVVAAILLLSISHAALAETVGRSQGTADFMFGPDDDAPAVKTPALRAKVAPVQTAEAVKPQLLEPARPSAVVPAQTAPSAAYAGVQLAPRKDGCPEPVQIPEAGNTPVTVTVNQDTQTIEIETPDPLPPKFKQQNKVSTGGTLKIPNGKIDKDPYCAKTPEMSKVVSMVKEETFAGTTCNVDQIRARSTVFPVYHTATFSDESGAPIPMPKAIRIDKGIFFHVAPTKYQNRLGEAISGECVRLHPTTAAFLYKQIEKYGSLKVVITKPPEYATNDPRYCDQRDVQAAIEAKRSGTGALAQSTGSEGVVGGIENWNPVAQLQDPFNQKGTGGLFGLGHIFNPQPQRTQQQQPQQLHPPRPAQPVGRRS